MKKKHFLIISVLLLVSQGLLAQDHSVHSSSRDLGAEQIFGLLEMPFLAIALIFSFLTATKLKGGKFGSGMTLLAWGFVVMALGHLHMQIAHIFGYNIFKNIFGDTLGNYIWFIALILTWGLSALGFYKIYKASKI
ncbi:hypothetical protein IWQ47_003728 [Aquimarina sp. EL_43]|uniref:hypothetical protein n=1 Tax=unclassified Aquimarina TaxID=2627091 RepID=UPI0018C98D18|nr:MULTISPECIES: hypothetical protein [unclassified Aquimarina]MBG6132300.1 hypothetical protein [Aquimarina sp. EL_35]MBG6152431.1 hypothetical protein [Aquimarina sp. EL_32]MBG6170642.1 hypothetical protein [Aquimarina sp. EL_43]